MTRTRGLGRGLSALIPSKPGVDEIDIDLIVPNPHQPRSAIDEASLEDLVESIREHGVLQPLLVSESEQEGVYQLIAGERRLVAARRAGFQRVPVVVKEAASVDLLELALVENIQRQDLNPLEEAQAYRRLADEFDMTQDAIASRVGRSRTAVANAIRLLSLSDEIKTSLASGEITEGHARALLGVEGDMARLDLWRAVVERGLTVRETEQLARRVASAGEATRQKSSSRTPRADPDTAALEDRIRASLGTKVELHHRPNGRGRLVVHFYSDEELEGVLHRLGITID